MEGYSLDRIKMTEIGEYDQKVDNDKQFLVKFTWFMFVAVAIFIIFSIFGQIQLYRSYSPIYVSRKV